MIVFLVCLVVSFLTSCQTLDRHESTPSGHVCSEAVQSIASFEDWQIIYAQARSTAGTLASASVIVPVGVVEIAAWVPLIIAGQITACAPGLILDVGLGTHGEFSQICMAVAPHYMRVPELSLTSGVVNGTRPWRRINIKEAIDAREHAAECYRKTGESADLNAAYETLEQLILDDRLYKKLTPLQLDQIDQELRDLKAALKTRRAVSGPLKDL